MAKSLSDTIDGLRFPLAKDGKQPVAPKPPEPAKEGHVGAIESGLMTRFKEVTSIPIPGRSDYWLIEDLSTADKNEGMLARFLKKKDLNADEITTLKKEAIQSPGNTRAKIQKLKKQYPQNSELYMLSAICTNGMLLNSSNRDEVLRGLKFAVKEGATSLMSNGISLYNCESFYKIYFTMLEKLRREQAKVLNMLSEDPRVAESRRELAYAMKTTEFLAGEKSKVTNVINHLKKKLKSSNYIALLNPMDIKEAAHHIENNTPKELCKVGSAAEMISYVYAFSLNFAHTPILGRLVNKILGLLPDKNLSILLRKISISSVRRFGQFKIALADQDRDEMIKIAKSILKENILGLSKCGSSPVYHSYEADIYFNLAYVAELTPGIFPTREYLEIAEKAIKAMETLAEKDMSKGHAYTENANSHLRRLNQLKEAKKGEEKDQ